MTNQYLPFGVAGGANVLSYSDYSALPARLVGFVAGKAASKQLNTVWRQSSVSTAMIGQFINDVGAVDALDDGSVANLLAGFQRALRNAYAQVANQQNYLLNAQFLINQDGFAGGAVSAGSYAIDQWGAPTGVASNMSFSGGVATIASGKMKQVVENPGVALGDMVLSWSGSSLAAINGGTPAASPIAFNHSAAANITVEFGPGTVSQPMFSRGAQVTPFIAPPIAVEKINCYRHYYVNTDQLDQYVPSAYTASQAWGLRYYVPLPTAMRAFPNITLVSYGLVDRASGTPSPRSDVSGFTMRVDVNSGVGIAGVSNLRFKADARIAL